MKMEGVRRCSIVAVYMVLDSIKPGREMVKDVNRERRLTYKLSILDTLRFPMQRKSKHKIPKVSGYIPRDSANPSSEAPTSSTQHPVVSKSVKVLPSGELKIEPATRYITAIPTPSTSHDTPEAPKTADELPWSSWTAFEPDGEAPSEAIATDPESSGVSEAQKL